MRKNIHGVPEQITLRAIVTSEPKDKDYKYTYTIKVKEIEGQDGCENTQLILNVNKNKLNGDVLKFGDEILLTGEFERPNGARNYKGFDYKNYLKSKRIYGTVQLDSYKLIGKDRADVGSKIINSVQNNMKENINEILGNEEAALCIGVLVGDREAISEEVEDDFQKSNLTHMLAVSGSHITYIINALAIMLSKTSKRFGKVFTIVFLVFFMALTGFTSSVVRASIMGMLILVASLVHRKSDTFNNLGISSLIILLVNPYAIADVGFTLSFGGTIGIVLLGSKVMKLLYKIVENVTNGKVSLNGETVIENDGEVFSIGKQLMRGSKEVGNSNSEGKIVEKDISKDNQIKEGNSKEQGRIAEKKRVIIEKIIEYLINSLSITLAANLVIIPIMAYNFSTVSFTFWLSNVLAAPVMEAATILGFIVYFISILFMPFAEFLGIFLNVLLKALLKIAEWTAVIPGSSIYIKTPYVIECAAYYLLLAVVFNVGQLRAVVKKYWYELKEAATYKCRVLGIVTSQREAGEKTNNKVSKRILPIVCTIIVITVTASVISIMPNNLRVYFVDVGQGDCTLIQTPTNKTILVDGGGSEFGSFDVGENTLLPYLLDRRITTIDYMLISHADGDHIGGLFAIVENLRVKNIIIGKQGEDSDNFNRLIELIKGKNINVIVAEKGEIIKTDKYSYFEVLFPEDTLIKENVLNNNSVVAKFNCMNFSMLFTGDIEEIAENRICELYANSNKLNATVLKVAHHGSKTSSTEKFLDLVKPKIAVIGVGANNNFGHPNEGVIERIEKYTNLIYRTDEMGEIELKFRKSGNLTQINGFIN